MMMYNDVWWFMTKYDLLFMIIYYLQWSVIYDDVRWCMMIYDRWLLMIYDNSCLMMIHDLRRFTMNYDFRWLVINDDLRFIQDKNCHHVYLNGRKERRALNTLKTVMNLVWPVVPECSSIKSIQEIRTNNPSKIFQPLRKYVSWPIIRPWART